jgi:hypothetical protein
MTRKKLADVRKLISHIPKERRQLSTWQNVEATLQACVAGDDTVNISARSPSAAARARVVFGTIRRNDTKPRSLLGYKCFRKLCDF